MGKQAKARRKREGWGFTSKKYRPVTASSRDSDGDSDDDDHDGSARGGASSGEKRKRGDPQPGRSGEIAAATKRRIEREARELKAYVGKAVVAAKRADKVAAKALPSPTALPPVDWAAERLAPFERSFWPESDEWQSADPHAEPTAACKLARKKLGIVVRGAAAPPPIESLSDSHLPASVRTFLKHATSFTRPSPVQAQTWPAALSGANTVVVAPTGTGKTLAYMVPAIPHVLARSNPLRVGEGPVVLVIVPTRELASQVEGVCSKMFKLFSLRCVALYGGIAKAEQVDRLLAPTHIVAATPGRLIDIVRSGDANLRSVTYFVLDEADRLLALGFKEQLDAIAGAVRPDAQRLLCSATAPAAVQAAVDAWVPNPVLIKVRPTAALIPDDRRDAGSSALAVVGPANDGNARDEELARDESAHEAVAVVERDEGGRGGEEAPTAASGVRQIVTVTAAHKRPRKLIKLIEKIETEAKTAGDRGGVTRVLIFANKIKTVNSIVEFLRKQRRKAAGVHSQLPQDTREANIADFRAGRLQLLVATDVAARGLDIKGLMHVVNYDMPGSLEQYVHRIGRCGRAGGTGTAVTLFTRNFAPIAPALVKLLRAGGHPVDRYLDQVVAAVGGVGAPSKDAEDAEEDAESEEEE